MFVKQKVVKIEIRQFISIDIFIGLIVLQNSGVFQVNQELLKNLMDYKKNNSQSINEIIPFEHMEASEKLLTELLEIVLVHGDHILTKDPVNIDSKILNIIHLVREFWSFYNYKIEKVNLEFNNKDSLVSYLETQYGSNLSLEHRLLIEQNSKIILIPVLSLIKQLGFNPVDDQLVLLVGIGSKEKTEEDDLIINHERYVKALCALGEKNRLMIMDILLHHGRSIEGIKLASILKITPATVSHHLNVLRQSGLISREQNGKVVLYTPEKTHLQELILFLERLKGGN